MVSWVKNKFKDLNQIDLKNELDKALENTAFGVSENERKTTLKRAKTTASVYNIAGVVLAFSLMLFNNNFSVVLLLSYPLIGILIITTSKGLIKFLTNIKRSVYNQVIVGMSLPSFTLLVRSFKDYSLNSLHNLWAPALTAGALVFTLLYVTGINKSVGSIKFQITAMLIVALLYGFGSIRQINCAFDNSELKIYTAIILNQRRTYGRSTTFYLKLSSWGPRYEEKEVEVHRRLYENTSIGDAVKVNFKKGLLNIPWFIVTKD